MQVSLKKLSRHKYAPAVSGAVSFLLLELMGAGFIFSFFGALIPPISQIAIKKYAAVKKYARISTQIPETVRAIGNAMKAGYSFEQALTFVANESTEPISEYLSKAVREIEYNFSIDKALTHLKKNANHNDVTLVVDGILMQYKIGGNLVEMLENIAYITGERLKLQNELKSLTAQGRFSGIIVGMLFPLSLLMFTIISPEYIGIMYSTIQGQFFLVLGIILEIIGFKLIWNITHVKI